MKPWTVLVYLAGDNGRFLSSLEGEGFADLAEMKEVGSSDAVDVVAQFDTMADGSCRRYHISRGQSLRDDMVQDLGETNSGDAQVLLDFISWGVHTYPAEHYLLVLWNHGSGWKDDDIYAPYRALRRKGDLPAASPQIGGRRVGRALFRYSVEAILEEEANQVLLTRAYAPRRGIEEAELPVAWIRPSLDGKAALRGAETYERPAVTAVRSGKKSHARAICFDDSSKDFLDSRELSQVLAATVSLLGRKLDVLGFDACLMSMIEVAYQCRHGANVMVASEDAEPGSGWPYRDILQTLSARPEMPAAKLGVAIASHYVDAYNRTLLLADPVTQAALDLERAAEAVAAVDELARVLLRGWRSRGLRSALADARARAQSFMDPDYIDLYDFASLLADRTTAKSVREACGHVLAAVEPGRAGSLVLADAHAGLAERNAHGLAIYFPHIGVSPFYAALDMSRDCSWAEFLETYLE